MSETAGCPSCGTKKLFLRSAYCANCNKRGCERCLFAFGYATTRVGSDSMAQRACSQECFEAWVGKTTALGYSPGTSGPAWTLGGTVLDPAFVPRARDLSERHRVRLQHQHARNLIEAERFEDAAKIYESLGLWKEAGEARRQGRRTVVTQVQVDVNDLIEQVRRGGLTTTYACPACQSPIPIGADTDPQSLRHCQYCGTAIQTTDLVEFLSRVVGYR